MEFVDVVHKRRMVRNFSDEDVDQATVDRILDLARRGPSAGYTQGQDFIVVRIPEMKQAIAATAKESDYVKRGYAPFISKAPVLVIPCTSEGAYIRRYQESDKARERGHEWPLPFWYMDGGAAVMLLLLAAVDEGLATAFSAIRDLPKLRTLLDIPDDVTPLGVIPIGYPAPDQRSPSLKRGRRPLKEVVHKERW